MRGGGECIKDKGFTFEFVSRIKCPRSNITIFKIRKTNIPRTIETENKTKPVINLVMFIILH